MDHTVTFEQHGKITALPTGASVFRQSSKEAVKVGDLVHPGETLIVAHEKEAESYEAISWEEIVPEAPKSEKPKAS